MVGVETTSAALRRDEQEVAAPSTILDFEMLENGNENRTETGTGNGDGNDFHSLSYWGSFKFHLFSLASCYRSGRAIESCPLHCLRGSAAQRSQILSCSSLVLTFV
jgi:hypothetical protein